MCFVAQSCLTLCDPMDRSLPSSSVLGDPPGKDTRVDCHALLQGIFPTKESNPGLPHCRRILCWGWWWGAPVSQETQSAGESRSTSHSRTQHLTEPSKPFP